MAFVAYAVLIPITHLTVWYNYTLEHPAIDNVEHLLFLALGYMFWRQIFGDDPNCYRLHPALKFGYLFLAIPIDTFTGLSLDQQVKELFPAYLTFHRTWGPSLVDDLHIGGVLMWVAGDTLMLWPMIPVALGVDAPRGAQSGPYRPPARCGRRSRGGRVGPVPGRSERRAWFEQS